MITASAAEQCPPSTEPSPLHVFGYPAVVLIVGAVAVLLTTRKMDAGTRRAVAIGLITIATVLGAAVALFIASFTAPCR